jgi:hypothetical protein
VLVTAARRSTEVGGNPLLPRLAVVERALAQLVDLAEEVREATDVVDYEALSKAARALRADLAGLAVVVRVDALQRMLDERLPALRRTSLPRAELVRRAVEGQAPTCSCGRAMRLRRGPYGAFWGCSGYPAHRRIRRLTSAQREALARWRLVA